MIPKLLVNSKPIALTNVNEKEKESPRSTNMSGDISETKPLYNQSIY